MNSKSTLSTAIEYLNQQDFAQAAVLCREICHQDPTNARAWHIQGIAEAQQQHLEKAIECFEEAVKAKPEVSNYSFNLGLAYAAVNDFNKAVACYQDAITKKPDSLEAHCNLGTTLAKIGRFDDAVDILRTATEHHADSSIAHYNLANVLGDTENWRDAFPPYQKAIQLDPSLVAARENLGKSLLRDNQIGAAIEVWRDWIAYAPNDSNLARHMLAGASGENVPERCDNESVMAIFNDEFAESFDRQLVFLDYRGPELVQEALSLLNPPLTGATILDAGCGTGLAATHLRPLAKHLVGMDLSPDMLEKAALRNQYDELIEDELTRHLQQQPDTYDVIIVADTFCYFGNLTSAFEAAFSSLHQNGRFIFTVERRDSADKTENGYQLMPHGRYCHEDSYVNECLINAGFKIERTVHEVIRTQSAQPVDGLVVTAVRGS